MSDGIGKYLETADSCESLKYMLMTIEQDMINSLGIPKERLGEISSSTSLIHNNPVNPARYHVRYPGMYGVSLYDPKKVLILKTIDTDVFEKKPWYKRLCQFIHRKLKHN